MPPAICDSEDEDDELGIQQKPAEVEVVKMSTRKVGEAIAQLDGASEPTTGSTARLETEINNAAMGLFESFSGPNSTLPATGSSQRRQHTLPPASQTCNGLHSRLRLSKTMDPDTVAASAALGVMSDESPRDYEVTTKPSPHPCHRSSFTGLRGDASLERFTEREPNVMCSDSGDTVEYDASCQERMLAEAMDSGAQETQRDERSKSSPHDSSGGPLSSLSAGNSDGSDRRNTAGPAKDILEPSSMMEGDCRLIRSRSREEVMIDHEVNEVKILPPRSPIVEIPRAQSGEKATQNHNLRMRTEDSPCKRTTRSESTDPLTSDEIAIGLPKERYVPRPSRRRATEFGDQVVDYAVVPEKAIKKRRRTLGSSGSHAADNHVPGRMADDANSGCKTQALNSPRDDHQARDALERPPAIRKTTTLSLNVDASDATQTKNIGLLDKHGKDSAQSMMPPTSPLKSKRKTKRSHTTIFEDHLSSSLRSPNLSQQQAQRRSALKDISNEDAGPSKRRCKHILPDDDDSDNGEEDELAKMTPVKRGESKKREPGRQNQIDDHTNYSNASAHPDPQVTDMCDEQGKYETSTKQRKRGRPRKKTETKEQIEPEAPVNAMLTGEKSEREKAHDDARTEEPSRYFELPGTATSQSAEPCKTSTPPSEKSNICFNAGMRVETSKHGSPTSHSPIKSSAKVNYRVGLSRKQRIQPLHASIRR